MQEAACPECGTRVGGTNHRTSDRPAMRFLADVRVPVPQGFDNRNLDMAAFEPH